MNIVYQCETCGKISDRAIEVTIKKCWRTHNIIEETLRLCPDCYQEVKDFIVALGGRKVKLEGGDHAGETLEVCRAQGGADPGVQEDPGGDPGEA